MKIKIGQDSLPCGYQIQELKIVGKHGQVDVRQLLISMRIVESIDHPVITGFLTIVDNFNMISNIPVIEGDRIVGTMKILDTEVYGQRFDPMGSISFEYEILKIQNMPKIKQSTGVVEFTFVTSAWTDNMKARISKAYNQIPYTQAAQQIFNEYLMKGGMQGLCSPKMLQVLEQSDELASFVLPGYQPLEAIFWLLGRSFVGEAVNFKFYEDRDKFNIVTLSRLMQGIPTMTLHTHVQNIVTASRPDTGLIIDENLLEGRYLNFNRISMDVNQDVFKASQNGTVPAKAFFIDDMAKTIGLTASDESNIFNSGAGVFGGCFSLEKNRTIEDETMSMGAMNGKDHIIDKDLSKILEQTNIEMVACRNMEGGLRTGTTEIDPKKYIRQARSQNALYKQVSIIGEIPGNFTIKAGDVVNLDMISSAILPSKLNEPPPLEIDKRFAGKWLVHSVSRLFLQGIDGHHTGLRLVRNDRDIQGAIQQGTSYWSCFGDLSSLGLDSFTTLFRTAEELANTVSSAANVVMNNVRVVQNAVSTVQNSIDRIRNLF